MYIKIYKDFDIINKLNIKPRINKSINQYLKITASYNNAN
jgi:hypothetical protein